MTVYYYYLGFNRDAVLRQGSRTLQVGFVEQAETTCSPASPFFVMQGDEIGFRVVDFRPMTPQSPTELAGLLSLIFTQADGQAGTPFGMKMPEPPPADAPAAPLDRSVSVLTGTMFTKIDPPPCDYYRNGTIYEVALYDDNGNMVPQPIPVFPVPYPGDGMFMQYAFTAMLRIDGETFPWTIDPEMEVGTT